MDHALKKHNADQYEREAQPHDQKMEGSAAGFQACPIVAAADSGRFGELCYEDVAKVFQNGTLHDRVDVKITSGRIRPDDLQCIRLKVAVCW